MAHLFPQPAGKILHRAAHQPPVGTHLAVHLRQAGLGELGGHAEKTGHDHPERRARPADGNGDGHPRDVAQPDSRGQRRRKRLEGSHLALVVGGAVFAADDAVGVAHHAHVDEVEAQRQEHRRDDQPGDDERHLRFARKHIEENDLRQKTVDGVKKASIAASAAKACCGSNNSSHRAGLWYFMHSP